MGVNKEMKKLLTTPILMLLATLAIVTLAGAVTEDTNGKFGSLKYDIKINHQEPDSRKSIQTEAGNLLKIGINFDSKKESREFDNFNIDVRLTDNDGRNVLAKTTKTIDKIEGKVITNTYLPFKIPPTIEQGKYKLEVELSTDETEKTEHYHREHHYDIRVAGADEEILIKDLLVQPNAQVDTAFDITARIKNTGEYNEEVKVTATIPEFGVKGETYIDLLEVGQTKESEPITLKLPCKAIAGDYTVVVTADYNFQQKTAVAETTYKLEGNICGKVEHTENTINSEKYTATLAQGDSKGRYNILVTNNDNVKRILVLETTENIQKYVRFLPTNVALLQPGETQDIVLDIKKLDSEEPIVFKVYVKDLEGNTIAEFREFTDKDYDRFGDNKADMKKLKHVLEVGLILLIITLLAVAVFVTFKQQKTER